MGVSSLSQLGPYNVHNDVCFLKGCIVEQIEVIVALDVEPVDGILAVDVAAGPDSDNGCVAGKEPEGERVMMFIF